MSYILLYYLLLPIILSVVFADLHVRWGSSTISCNLFVHIYTCNDYVLYHNTKVMYMKTKGILIIITTLTSLRPKKLKQSLCLS